MARKGQNWDWAFQNLGFGQLCSPICLGACGDSWTEVCVSKLSPSWHCSAPPASQGSCQKEVCNNGDHETVKGRVNGEKSQLSSQDLSISPPRKYLLIYSFTNQNIHSPSLSKMRPLWLKTPWLHLADPVLQAAESRLHTDGLACLPSARLCT